METKFQTSFIPKTNLEPVSGGQKKPLGLLTFIATIIFFISVLVAGGMFGWHKYLSTQKVKMQQDLERNIKAFEPQTLQEYVRLNTRLNAAQQLLAKHVAVSYIFDFLSENTLQSVSFSDFKYSIEADGSASLNLNGSAKSYNAVAYQSEVLGRERALQDPIFSNLDLDNGGNVTFNFTTTVNPGFISYTRKAVQAALEQNSGDVVPLTGTPSGQGVILTGNSSGDSLGGGLPRVATSTSTSTPRR
ncbi:MAG: hypothetical protein WC761_06890 [Candidatus Paceibacterota bacterium]|jgi:hypothetical protein